MPVAPWNLESLKAEMGSKRFLLQAPRLSKIREQRAMQDDEGFVVRHYAAPVCYDTRLFLEKNSDSLHVSLNSLMEQSTWVPKFY